MPPKIEILVDDAGLQAALARLSATLGDMTPIMQAVANELLSQTEINFAQQGRPAWSPLAQITIKERTRQGSWPGRILQISPAGLAPSIQTAAGPDFARIGSNKPYAAIHQFGGQAGRNHKVRIPARPYLPVNTDGQLQPEAREAILAIIEAKLAAAVAG
jgi:phage virion morphogenesis protein